MSPIFLGGKVWYAPCSLTEAVQMYVPGKMVGSDKVLVDIGTGYFVEKVRQRFGAND